MANRPAISTALPFISIVLAAAAVGLGLRIQHSRIQSAALVYWRHRMDASADATRSSVQGWLDERQQDDRMLSRQADKSSTLFAGGRAAATAIRDISALITEMANERGYRGIWVLRANGSTVVASENADSLPPAIRALASEVAHSGMSQTAGPLGTSAGEQLFVVIEPVIRTARNHSSKTLGSIVLGIDPYQSLFPTVLLEQDGIEVVWHRLVQHIGDEMVVLTPSRRPVAGPGELRAPWESAPTSARLAASGVDSSGEFLGFGDVPLIVATRHIPETGWGIVRAIEEKEAFAAGEREFRLEVLVALALFLLGVAVTYGTRRRQATTRRLAVAEAEARYKLLAEHATDIIVRQDVAGNVLYVSPACRQLLGYEPEELTSVSPLHFVHPDDEEVARNAHEVVFRNPLGLPVPYRLRRADGSYVWFETTGQPVIDQ